MILVRCGTWGVVAAHAGDPLGLLLRLRNAALDLGAR
jgi:hypothetical protein